MSQPQDLLTTQEVATQFRTTVSTVARWARLGRLPCVRLPGGTLRFRRSDVEAVFAGPEGPDRTEPEAVVG